MESLPKDELLEFNDDTFKTLRKQYNFEKKEDMDAAIDVFEEWVKKQNHFIKKDYSREYLERLIILHKGSVERAKTHMDQLCTLKTLLPQFFECHNVRNECVPFLDGAITPTVLPKMTPEHYRVLLYKVNEKKLSPSICMKSYALSTILTEYLKAHDYNNGIVSIVDYRDMNILDGVKDINFMELRQMVTIAMDGFGYRVKGIHMLTSSTAVDILVKLMKPMYSPKIANRIYVHKTMESLHEVVSKEILPVEYGGNEMPLNTIYDKLIDTLTTNHFMEHIKVMNTARVNESMRMNDTVKDQYLGITGTFRTLSVD